MTSSDSRASRYGTERRRLALIPGLIAAVALVVGVATLDDGPLMVIRFIAAIFAGIVGVFAVQSRQWWWLPFLAAIAILWNPVWMLELPTNGWQFAHYLGILVFLIAGWRITVAVPNAR